MKQRLYIVDERILQLADILKQKGQIVFRKEMFDAVEISKQKVNNVKSGNESFTVKQIEAICKKFNVDVNWVFGFRDGIPFRKSAKTLPEREHRNQKDATNKLKIK